MDGLFRWEIESHIARLLCNRVIVAAVTKQIRGKSWEVLYCTDKSGLHPTMYSAMIACERHFHIASELARA